MGLSRSSQRKRRDTNDELETQPPNVRNTTKGHPRTQIENVVESYLVDLKSRRKRYILEKTRAAASTNQLMTFLGLLGKTRAPRKERDLGASFSKAVAFGIPEHVYRRIRRATDNYRVQVL